MAQIEIGERAAGRDVGQGVRVARAPRLVAELAREFREAAIDLLPLAGERLGTLLFRRPLRFQHDCDRSIADAVRKRLPALDRDPLPARLRKESGHRTYLIQELRY